MKKFSLAISMVWLFCGLGVEAATDRNYAGVEKYIQDLAAKYPSNVTLFHLPVSDSKQAPIGMKVGSGSGRTLVVATHHGNEYGSTEVALGFAASIAAQPIPGQVVYVIPVLNIGGYNTRTRQERDARGVLRDPNRDYPGPCGTEGPFFLKSTKALADFVAQEKIITSATLHTSYPAVMYPWGIATRDLATDYPDTFLSLSNYATQESHYAVGNSTELLYPADGAFEDYAFWKHGAWSILFELGYSHNPTEPQVQEMIRINVPGIRRMLAQSPVFPAPKHDFAGQCDMRLSDLDRHDE